MLNNRIDEYQAFGRSVYRNGLYLSRRLPEAHSHSFLSCCEKNTQSKSKRSEELKRWWRQFQTPSSCAFLST